jgi:RNA 2',3'-cyclic 3'-phosphodiesterase
MSMRLFVALDVSDSVRRRAADLIEMVSGRIGAVGAGLAWVPPDRLHVTLLFIGHVDASTADDVRRRLSTPYDLTPFTVEFRGLGLFPPGGRPRVVWAGIERGSADVGRLHVETVLRLEGVPFRREARPFSAHLTLGRFREQGPARVRRELLALAPPEIGRCTIEAVTLYESRLSPRGAAYIPVLRSPLQGGG